MLKNPKICCSTRSNAGEDLPGPRVFDNPADGGLLHLEEELGLMAPAVRQERPLKLGISVNLSDYANLRAFYSWLQTVGEVRGGSHADDLPVYWAPSTI